MNIPTLDHPMRPEEMDWMASFRVVVNKRLAKAKAMQFDRRILREQVPGGVETVREFPRVG